MKYFLRFAALACAISTLFVACDPESDTPKDDEDTIEITPENLKGTWEAEVERDFAQGYYQKWRVTFDGNTYTTWHTHQTVLKTPDDHTGHSVRVGNKETGTWTYANGQITLTAQRQFASYVMTSMDPVEYTIYIYHEDTMECDSWYETPEYFVGLSDPTTWGVTLTRKTLSARINMDTFKFEKVK